MAMPARDRRRHPAAVTSASGSRRRRQREHAKLLRDALDFPACRIDGTSRLPTGPPVGTPAVQRDARVQEHHQRSR